VWLLNGMIGQRYVEKPLNSHIMLITSDAYTQLEDTLAKMAEAAELDQTRWNRLKSAYEAISDWFSDDSDFFQKVKIEIYP